MLKSVVSLSLCLAAACAQAVPSALLNPDVTPATLDQTICRAGYTKTVTTTNGAFTTPLRSAFHGVLLQPKPLGAKP